MDQYKAIANDPAKLEEHLKAAWAKLDPQGKGFLTPQEFGMGMGKLAREMNLPGAPPSQEEREKLKTIVDPQGTGKITFEGFTRLVKARIEKARQEGKL